MERVVRRGGTLDYQNKIMATLFYQPSTRTRFSFEAAMYRLGGKVFSTEQARFFSSEVEGEHLEDTIRTISGYSDVIVLRHSEVGGAARAAAVSRVPVINAGDGNGGQHPTQALLDLYTIFRERRTLDGLSIAIIGDLDRGRTARSLAYLLSKFERVKIWFVSPPELQMSRDILDHLEENDVCYGIETELGPRPRARRRRLSHADPPRPAPGTAAGKEIRDRYRDAASACGPMLSYCTPSPERRNWTRPSTRTPGPATSGRRTTGCMCGWRC